MINAINGNNQINWYTLLSTQKKSSGSASGSTDNLDSAEIGGQMFGAPGMGERKDPLEALVNDGTITSDQASAIDNALRSAMQSGQGPGAGKDPLADLVSAGTITQGQADSVKSTLDASRPDRKDFMSNVLDSLVTDGTLTQDQADSVKQAMKPPAPPPSKTGSSEAAGSASSSDATTELSGLTEEEILQLLSSGKISARQAQSALDKLESKDSSGSVSAASSGTDSGSRRANPLDSLVSSGVITQGQEDAIRSAFQQAMETRKAMMAYSAGASQRV